MVRLEVPEKASGTILWIERSVRSREALFKPSNAYCGIVEIVLPVRMIFVPLGSDANARLSRVKASHRWYDRSTIFKLLLLAKLCAWTESNSLSRSMTFVRFSRCRRIGTEPLSLLYAMFMCSRLVVPVLLRVHVLVFSSSISHFE